MTNSKDSTSQNHFISDMGYRICFTIVDFVITESDILRIILIARSNHILMDILYIFRIIIAMIINRRILSYTY